MVPTGFPTTSTTFFTGRGSYRELWATELVHQYLLHGEKSSISHDLTNVLLPHEMLNTHITSAYKAFAHIKRDPACQKMWIAGLIEAKVTAFNVKMSSLWKQIWATEQAGTTACMVQAVLSGPRKLGSFPW